MKFIEEVKNNMLPFWMSMLDERGGFYGYADSNGKIKPNAVKGGIYHSRILWFFCNAYLLTKEAGLKRYIDHAYTFIKSKLIDYQNIGIYWSVKRNGEIDDSSKHTYNNAFLIYALSSYYKVTHEGEALELALSLFRQVELAKNEEGFYWEEFDNAYNKQENKKLGSKEGNSVYTMNTMLHIIEAYTELYEVSRGEDVKAALLSLLSLIERRAYNSSKGRFEVFFDKDMNSIADIHSYGHDIETAWLCDRAMQVLSCEIASLSRITKQLSETVLSMAFDGQAVSYESRKGRVNSNRVWWVQAESVVGFVNAYQRAGGERFRQAARQVYNYSLSNIVGKEWNWLTRKDGTTARKPLADMWKCPYHNGRMFFELEKRKAEI